MTEHTQEELIEDLVVSQSKYMECSICKQEVGFSNDGDEERMEEHFIEKHGLKKE